MWQIFESLYGWEFFLSLPSVWMTVWPNRKFLIQILYSQYFENITSFFISSSVLIPFHVPCFFILEINSKFCHSFKFSRHVSLSPMLWNSMEPSNLFLFVCFNLFWIMRNLLSFFKYFFLTAFISHFS